MRNFKELEIWVDARKLVKQIYYLTTALPPEEKFGLTSQIKRCVISIPSNIAEGSAKYSEKDFARFLQISLGSCFELESHLLLCADLNLLKISDIASSIDYVERLQKRINSLIKYVISRSNS